MLPKPKNLALYNRVKAAAKKKFKVWPSAYASGWVVKEYKRRGGTYSGGKKSSGGLTRWFGEKWVNVCTSPRRPCGRPGKLSLGEWKKKYPYCRPSRRVSRSTPKTVSELSKEELKRRCKRKRKSPLKKVLARGSRRRERSVRKSVRASRRRSR